MNLAVWGSPIGHSKSPQLHRAALAAQGIEWSYGRREVTEATFAAAIAGLDESWRGLSLTMPLKYLAHEHAQVRDEAAELSGAVNTLLWDNGTVHGFNTDIPGTVRAITARVGTVSGHAEILGGGATAGSLLVAAARLGMSSARLHVRTPARAAATLALGERVGLAMEVAVLGEAAISQDTGLFVSTLPGGAEIPVTVDEELCRRSPLFDVAYSPWPSTLALRWQDAGGAVVSGLDMLVHQALIQQRIFVHGDAVTELADESAVLAAMFAAIAD